MDKMFTHQKQTQTTRPVDTARGKLLWKRQEMRENNMKKLHNGKIPPVLVLESNSERKLSPIQQALNLSLEKHKFPAGDDVGLCLR